MSNKGKKADADNGDILSPDNVRMISKALTYNIDENPGSVDQESADASTESMGMESEPEGTKKKTASKEDDVTMTKDTRPKVNASTEALIDSTEENLMMYMKAVMAKAPTQKGSVSTSSSLAEQNRSLQHLHPRRPGCPGVGTLSAWEIVIPTTGYKS
jgi:hypothetical protein